MGMKLFKWYRWTNDDTSYVLPIIKEPKGDLKVYYYTIHLDTWRESVFASPFYDLTAGLSPSQDKLQKLIKFVWKKHEAVGRI